MAQNEAGPDVIVGRDSFGVAIDHDRLVTGFLESEAGVHTAVIELNTLTNAVGSRAQDHHSRFCPRSNFIFVLISRVVVRSHSVKLSRAGVNRLKSRSDSLT